MTGNTAPQGPKAGNTAPRVWNYLETWTADCVNDTIVEWICQNTYCSNKIKWNQEFYIFGIVIIINNFGWTIGIHNNSNNHCQNRRKERECECWKINKSTCGAREQVSRKILIITRGHSKESLCYSHFKSLICAFFVTKSWRPAAFMMPIAFWAAVLN